MIQNIALVTTLFDYPEYYLPSFYKNACNYFSDNDIHIIRYQDHKPDWSLYQKLYYYKIYQNLEYFQNKLLNKYEYILFADATDTNIYKPIDNTIFDVFHSFDSNIVFCGEKCLWPPVDHGNMYNSKPKLSDRFYLNSGLYMGYTAKIIEYMKEIIAHNRTFYDDQGHWTIQYLLSSDIIIDQNNLLFFSTLNSKEDVNLNKKQITRYSPYFIHDNGPHNEDTIKMADIL
jgi:hypothetical protein